MWDTSICLVLVAFERRGWSQGFGNQKKLPMRESLPVWPPAVLSFALFTVSQNAPSLNETLDGCVFR